MKRGWRARRCSPSSTARCHARTRPPDRPRFADEIIFRLGGGVPGIAETKIYYVKFGRRRKRSGPWTTTGHQHSITHLGTVSLSPRVSPDNTRVAFARSADRLPDPHVLATAWPHGQLPLAGRHDHLPRLVAQRRDDLAFSSSRSGDPEIWIADANGGGSHRVTRFRGPDVSPVFNPKTGDADRMDQRTHWPAPALHHGIRWLRRHRMTDGGYATSPSWSPNGQFLAFAWDRKYGPGAPGGQDIYVMEVATKRWIQLTHDGGRCDFPSWSPDGRHIVFERPLGHQSEIWSMLADGTQQHALTLTETTLCQTGVGSKRVELWYSRVT